MTKYATVYAAAMSKVAAGETIQTATPKSLLGSWAGRAAGFGKDMFNKGKAALNNGKAMDMLPNKQTISNAAKKVINNPVTTSLYEDFVARPLEPNGLVRQAANPGFFHKSKGTITDFKRPRPDWKRLGTKAAEGLIWHYLTK